MSIPIVPGVAALAADYDAFLVDLWGVVHDGIAPYAGVTDCLARLRAAGKRVVLLSNAQRRSAHAAAALARMGIERARYDAIVTSGDATRAELAARADPWCAALGRNYFYIGKAMDADLLAGLDYVRADDIAAADFLLVTGLETDIDPPRTRVADYDALLAAAAARGQPMACANPDLAVIRGGAREPCAGALAARYAALGGDVRYEGKPHAGVYDFCFATLGGIARDRVLAVGDGLATDIAGARAAGLDSLLITGGLLAEAWGVAREAPPDPAHLEAACATTAPDFAAAAFVW